MIVLTLNSGSTSVKLGVYDTAGARPILRAGGPAAYAEITPAAMFDMTRPDDRG